MVSISVENQTESMTDQNIFWFENMSSIHTSFKKVMTDSVTCRSYNHFDTKNIDHYNANHFIFQNITSFHICIRTGVVFS